MNAKSDTKVASYRAATRLLAGALVIIGLVFFMGVAVAQDKKEAAPKKTAAAQDKKTAAAQDKKTAAVPSGQYKIGVIDRKVVLDGYKKVETEYSKLQEEVDERQKEITKLSDQITADKEKYDEDKDSLSAEEKGEREAEIQNDYRNYQAKLQMQQAEIDSKERLLMKKIFGEIDKAVEKIGDKQGYYLILEGGIARSGVIWYSPTIDISQKVVEALNSTP